MTDRHRIAGLDLDEYRALDGTGYVAGPPGPSNGTIAAWAAASLQRSRERRGLRGRLADDSWAAACGLILGGAIVIGALLGGH